MAKGILNIYQQLAGSEEEFSLREILFHKTCIIIALLLNVALGLAIFLNFWEVVLAVIVSEVILTIAFWLSRFMKLYLWGWWIVIIFSYLLFIINFFLNGGNDGPTLLLSYISLVFLSATTKSQYQWIWALIHSLIFSSLSFYVFYVDSSWINAYVSPEVRVLDLALSYIMGAFFISALLSMVRAAYEKQKEKAIAQHQQVLAKEQQLKDSNKDLTRILSILAHDVRNPLASIEGYLQLNESGDLDPNLRDSLNKDLLKLVKGTSYMLDDMLHWSKGQLHGHTANMSMQMLGPWLRPTLEHMEALAKAKNIQIKSFYKATERAWMDPNMCTVILRNLIQNAIKFSPAGTQMEISLKKEGANFIVSVKDEGLGINPEQLKKLFTINAESKIGTRKEMGSGLGLILCKDYTEAQGGKIWVESALDKGSVFSFNIPQDRQSDDSEKGLDEKKTT